MIRFSKYYLLYLFLSLLVIVPGVVSLVRFGLRPAVDFTGGTLVELQAKHTLDLNVLRTRAEALKMEIVEITTTDKKRVTLRFKQTSEQTLNTYLSAIEDKENPHDVVRNESIGPVIGKELLSKAIVAALLAIIGILCYVAYAFRNVKFGVSAVVSLVHDTLVMFGCFSLFGHFFGVEVDTLFVTAFLTTMSFSVHDTIVIFDRIREYRHRDQKMPLDELSDMALTETMGRSIVNSFTIIFMLLMLVLAGGDSIKWFAVALLIGTITGTYSSPFVATPVLVLWDRWERKKKNIR